MWLKTLKQFTENINLNDLLHTQSITILLNKHIFVLLSTQVLVGLYLNTHVINSLRDSLFVTVVYVV